MWRHHPASSSSRKPNGDGTFQTASTHSTTFSIGLPIRAIDLNGNQRPDFYVVGLDSTGNDTEIALLLDNGTGGFSPPVNHPVAGLDPKGVTAGDFDGDGNVDFAVIGAPTPAGSCCTVQLLRGTGSGTYGSLVTVNFQAGSTVNYLGALTAKDLDGDGKADLVLGGDFMVTGGSIVTGILVALGTGSGFAPEIIYPTSNDPADIQVADLNHDQKPDIAAISDANNNNHIYSLLGNGNGTFQGVRSFVLPLGEPSYFAIADVNQDNQLDLISSSTMKTSVVISIGDGLGGFMTSANPTLTQAPSGVAAGDVNGDGHPDLLFSFDTVTPVQVLLNTP